MYFNESGKLYNEPTTFWFVSISCLEYMLRMLRLKPLECEFLAPNGLHALLVNGFRTTRMAVACRAVDEVVNDPSDQWMPKVYYAKDYLDYTDWSVLSETGGMPVGYALSWKPRKTRPETDACSLWAQFKRSKPLKPSLDQIRLPLGATV